MSKKAINKIGKYIRRIVALCTIATLGFSATVQASGYIQQYTQSQSSVFDSRAATTLFVGAAVKSAVSGETVSVSLVVPDEVPRDEALQDEIFQEVEAFDEVVYDRDFIIDETFPESPTQTVEPQPTPSPTPQPSPEANFVPMFNINMTWQQMYRVGVQYPQYEMDGVGIISPTWFSIVDDKNKTADADLYPLGGETGLYLQSYASKVYMAEANINGMTVWPMFKREDKLTLSQVSAFLRSDTARQTCLEVLMQIAEEYGFTGINMDFEYMYQSDRDYYSNFVGELSQLTRPAGLVLSVDVNRYDAGSANWSLCYDRNTLGQHADYIVLMAYDEHVPAGKKSGSTASLPWTVSSIESLLTEVPAEKVILGIPFYTRVWEEDSAGNVIKTTAIGFETVARLLRENSPEVVFDTKTEQNFAKWTKNGTIYKIWLEDETSIAARLNLVSEYGLAGVASWSNSFAEKSPNIWQLISSKLTVGNK